MEIFVSLYSLILIISTKHLPKINETRHQYFSISMLNQFETGCVIQANHAFPNHSVPYISGSSMPPRKNPVTLYKPYYYQFSNFEKLPEEKKAVILKSGIAEFSQKSYADVNTDKITKNYGKRKDS